LPDVRSALAYAVPPSESAAGPAGHVARLETREPRRLAGSGGVNCRAPARGLNLRGVVALGDRRDSGAEGGVAERRL
jgi:hypothetical protein